MMVNLKMVSLTDMVAYNIIMVIFIMVFGRIIMPMEMESLFQVMGLSIKVSSMKANMIMMEI